MVVVVAMSLQVYIHIWKVLVQHFLPRPAAYRFRVYFVWVVVVVVVVGFPHTATAIATTTAAAPVSHTFATERIIIQHFGKPKIECKSNEIVFVSAYTEIRNECTRNSCVMAKDVIHFSFVCGDMFVSYLGMPMLLISGYKYAITLIRHWYRQCWCALTSRLQSKIKLNICQTNEVTVHTHTHRQTRRETWRGRGGGGDTDFTGISVSFDNDSKCDAKILN